MTQTRYRLSGVIHFPISHLFVTFLMWLADLDPETEALITSLKSIIRSQALELEKTNGALTGAREQLEQLQSQPPPVQVRFFFLRSVTLDSG